MKNKDILSQVKNKGKERFAKVLLNFIYSLSMYLWSVYDVVGTIKYIEIH